MIWIILGLIAWFGCGVWACGRVYAHLRREFGVPDKLTEDSVLSTVAIVFGPAAALAAVVMAHSGHGWLWPWSKS